MDILFTAFLLSVVLVGIHSFFGMEILKRGIIFTDLAIGQMAALGAAFSLLFFEGQFLYPISLFFAFFGSFCNSISYEGREAFRGIHWTYLRLWHCDRFPNPLQISPRHGGFPAASGQRFAFRFPKRYLHNYRYLLLNRNRSLPDREIF